MNPLISAALVVLFVGFLFFNVLWSQRFPFQRVAAIASVMALVFFSIQCGNAIGRMTALCEHTRFVKELFFRLTATAPESLGLHMAYLSEKFQFPSRYSEEGGKEQESLLDTFVASQKTK